PFQERWTRQVLASHQHAREIAFGADHQGGKKAHEETDAVALRRRHAAPVAAERGDVELASDEVVVVRKAGREAAHAVTDPVDRPLGEGAPRLGERAWHI